MSQPVALGCFALGPALRDAEPRRPVLGFGDQPQAGADVRKVDHSIPGLLPCGARLGTGGISATVSCCV
jgi:hypothetical protein